MNITITRHEQLLLSVNEVEDIVDKWLDEKVGEVGDHYVHDSKLFRQDDYGHHRGGTNDVLIRRVTGLPVRQPGEFHSSEEMSAYQYDFIVQCIGFKDARKLFKEARKADK